MMKLPIRIYYEDTDAGGIVYHANYLKFCERGRTELLRSLGFDNTSLLDSEGMLFVVRHIEADYLAPARLDDCLDVQTSIADLGKTRIVMKQAVCKGAQALFEMKVTIVCVSRDGKPVRPPESVIKIFTECMERDRHG